MGLQADLWLEIGKAFDTDLADAVQTMVLVDNKNSIYDPSTGVYTETGLTYSTRGTLSSYTQLEMINSGGAINVNDSKVLMLTNEVSIIPKTDHLLRVASLEYRILKVKVDAAKVAYTLQVRES